MPSLKSLKVRINSVKSTQKITKAMKMVAAAKLRRAKEAAEAARPYAERMERMLASLATSMQGNENAPALLNGMGQDKVHLIIVATGDRGLCGAFNSSIFRATRRKIQELQGAGKTVKLLCVGRKGYEMLLSNYKTLMVSGVRQIAGKRVAYSDAEDVGRVVTEMFINREFDVAHIVYNHFKSAISQIVTFQQLIPLPAPAEAAAPVNNVIYDYEPDEEEVLKELLPRNIGIQVFKALLENAASEQGSRMSAMDNATRNAGEMIKKLTLVYNRSRQAAITKELIEIISGAEAV